MNPIQVGRTKIQAKYGINYFHYNTATIMRLLPYRKFSDKKTLKSKKKWNVFEMYDNTIC